MLSTDQITDIPSSSSCHVLSAHLLPYEFIIAPRWDHSVQAQASSGSLRRKWIIMEGRGGMFSKKVFSNCEIFSLCTAVASDVYQRSPALGQSLPLNHTCRFRLWHLLVSFAEQWTHFSPWSCGRRQVLFWLTVIWPAVQKHSKHLVCI